jgi:hypothetical protein
VVYCETSAPELARRNAARDDRERVPAAVIERMLARWSVPTPDEAHRVSYVVDGVDRPASQDPVRPPWPPTGARVV